MKKLPNLDAQHGFIEFAERMGGFSAMVPEPTLKVDLDASTAHLQSFQLENQIAHAKMGNLEALKHVSDAIDKGLFDVTLSTVTGEDGAPPIMADALQSRRPLFDAFFASFGQARFTQAIGEPGGPAFPVPVLVAEPHGTKDFVPLLAKAFEALELMDRSLETMGMDLHDKPRIELFAKALSMACAMGMPEAIGPLAARCPDAVREPLWIGSSTEGIWRKHMPFGETHLATPAFFAVQYGHPECLDALRAAGLERQFCLTHSSKPGCDTKPIAHHEFFSRFSLSILPSQLPAMLERMDHKTVKNNPGMKAIESTQTLSQFKSLRTFLPAFMESGTFDKLGVNDVLHAACVNNVPEVVEFFVSKAPWSSMTSSLITDVAIKSGGRPVEDALVALLKVAHEQGQTQMFASYESSDQRQADPTNQYQPQEDCEVSVTEPAYSVIRAGMRETLVLLMKNGLKPDEKDDFSTSPLDIARETRMQNMEHVMKTFMARSTVLGILDEMEASDAEPASKKNTKPSP